MIGRLNRRWFRFEHLSEPGRSISMRVCELAAVLDVSVPDGDEKEAGMRKLLEAKDCFVRAALEPENERTRRV